MDKILEQVRDFADKAHGNQQRKYTPERYIVHPVRVMEMCDRYGASLPMKAAALLHDVLEDTAVSEEQLNRFLSSVMNEVEARQTLNLVIELTDVYTKQRYARWNRRKRKRKEAERIEKTSAESQTIKYADIIDNCKEIVAADPDFAGTFLSECQMLLQKVPKGNPQLYKEAMDTVAQCIQKLPKEFKSRR